MSASTAAVRTVPPRDRVVVFSSESHSSFLAGKVHGSQNHVMVACVGRVYLRPVQNRQSGQDQVVALRQIQAQPAYEYGSLFGGHRLIGTGKPVRWVTGSEFCHRGQRVGHNAKRFLQQLLLRAVQRVEKVGVATEYMRCTVGVLVSQYHAGIRYCFAKESQLAQPVGIVSCSIEVKIGGSETVGDSSSSSSSSSSSTRNPLHVCWQSTWRRLATTVKKVAHQSVLLLNNPVFYVQSVPHGKGPEAWQLDEGGRVRRRRDENVAVEYCGEARVFCRRHDVELWAKG